MKRRNIDSSKHRRQFHFRKCKFTENIYTSNAFVYLKFLAFWALIMIADFILEFRFEFLWPLWLLMRSTFDSFKYQGLLFSIFFALAALTCDFFCYILIPVQWLFFASSTYVWVQYVWHTERGVCLPTITLWLLFVYVEASMRMKNLKTIDFCRPFAAHCIGYPIVTLGFGFKSYLNYKWMLKKQRKVRKTNNYYQKLLMQALPVEMQHLFDTEQTKQIQIEEEISQPQQAIALNDNVHNQITSNSQKEKNVQTKKSTTVNSQLSIYDDDLPYIQQKDHSTTAAAANSIKYQPSQLFSGQCDSVVVGNSNSSSSNSKTSITSSTEHDQLKQSSSNKTSFGKNNKNNSQTAKTTTITTQMITDSAQQNPNPSASSTTNNTNSGDDQAKSVCTAQPSHNHTNININMTINATAIAAAAAQNTTINTNGQQTNPKANATKSKNKKANTNNKELQSQQTNTTIQVTKDDFLQHLEDDLKKLQQELQTQKSTESYLRSQVNYYTKMELKFEKIQQDNEQLQVRIQKLQAQKEKEKDELGQAYEKRLQEEKRSKISLEQRLQQQEKKTSEQVTVHGNMLSSMTNIKILKKTDCNEYCQQKIKDYEKENKSLMEQLADKQDRLRTYENEIKSLLKFRDSQNRMESLMSALNVMEEKNLNLQDSLSAETRFKLDLFSALGETRRQLDSTLNQLEAKDKEIHGLKCMLKTAFASSNDSLNQMSSAQQVDNNFINHLLTQSSNFNNNSSNQANPSQYISSNTQLDCLFSTQLDPSASIYTPKI